MLITVSQHGVQFIGGYSQLLQLRMFHDIVFPIS